MDRQAIEPEAARGPVRPMGIAATLVANLLVFVVVGYAAALNALDPDSYYLSVQEDEYLEWATFWAFLVAAGGFVAAARGQRRATGALPWFLFGVGLFCLFVALEEISWGQRLLGYRPPSYFLAHNYQQEFNIHNVVQGTLRKLALKSVILGYGVLLPLAGLVPAMGQLISRLAVVPPPPQLIPAFLAAFFTYQVYPWRFSGELVELMLGLGFLFCALEGIRSFRQDGAAAEKLMRRLGPLVVAWLAVIGLGVGQAGLTRMQRAAHPESVAAARAETQALKQDFVAMARRNGGHPATACGLHKRVYTFVQHYDKDYLRRGSFVGLTAQGLPQERAAFFIDPWNSPYWVRHRCAQKDRARRIFVYSFGPNRRRDSSRWEILGDDIGTVILEEGRVPRERAQR